MNTTIDVPDDTILGTLCSAFEGGSNHWIKDVDAELPKGVSMAEFREGGQRQLPGTYWHWTQLVPMAEDCALLIRGIDSPHKKLRLDRLALKRGLVVMATKYARHFGDMISENGDANTGDVFLQCCLFGDVIYG